MRRVDPRVEVRSGQGQGGGRVSKEHSSGNPHRRETFDEELARLRAEVAELYTRMR